MPTPSTNDIKSAWQQEYQRKGIPSSFRQDPTQPVVEFVSWLKSRSVTEGRAADIGCGLGRNSFYLAAQGFTVAALELLEENVAAVNQHAAAHNAAIRAFVHDAAQRWPIDSRSLDVVIDVFCYKHITTKEGQARYRQELWRTLKPRGFYFVSLASEGDGFYGPLLEQSPCSQEKLIVDPHSGIASFLYSPQDLIAEFSHLFEVVEINEQISTSPMHGKEYPRRVINAVFKP